MIKTTTLFHTPLYKEDEDAKLNTLKEYCRNYLSFLIDEGYDVKVVHQASTRQCVVNNYPRYKITIDKSIPKQGNFRRPGILIDGTFSTHNITFFFNDKVKDTFIPFLYQLSKDYTIHNEYICLKLAVMSIVKELSPGINEVAENRYNVVDIINESINESRGICEIEIELSIIN
jgi:hypothetical protein